MKDIRAIQEVLVQLEDVLRRGNNPNWANAIETLMHEFAQDPDTTVGDVIRLFGGSGSLNDIVLYGNGTPLIRENNDLDKLRSNLYELCHAK